MRAFVIDAIGDRGRIADVAEPVPEPGEVVIRVHAVGLIASDWRVRGGSRMPRQEHRFPAILGFDFAGEVVDGQGSASWPAGCRVFGIAHKPFIGAGCLAEYVTMPADGPMAPTPDFLTDVEASALVSGWLTSLAVTDQVELASGDVVALLGASGGVGSVLTQILSRRGMDVVAVTRAANRDYVLGLGAVSAVPYDHVDPVSALRDEFPAGIDALVDLISPAARLRDLAATVRPGGHVCSAVGAADLEGLQRDGWRPTNVATKPSPDTLAALTTTWTSAGYRLPEMRLLSFDETALGIDLLQEGHIRGKLVVSMM
jgi:NADPH:quinone reductase